MSKERETNMEEGSTYQGSDDHFENCSRRQQIGVSVTGSDNDNNKSFVRARASEQDYVPRVIHD